MKKNAIFGVICLCVAPCVAPAAFSDQIDFEFEADFVGAVLDADGAANPQNLLFDIMLGIENEHLFDNGAALGYRFESRLQADNTSRPGYSGLFLSSSDETAIASPSTGLSSGAPSLKHDMKAGVELAYLYVDAPWGDVSLGRDIGAASRLDARPPGLLNLAGVHSSRLDPTGLSFVRARNDPTGPSTKLTYLSPRWVGIRLGASFTPDIDPDSVDFDVDELPNNVVTADLKNAAEFGLSFRHKFIRSDISIRAGVTAVLAEAESADSRFDEFQSYGAGLELDKGPWSGGVRYLNSNNAVDNGNYEALETSILRAVGDWTVGVELGAASDRLLNLEGVSWMVGASRPLTDHLDIGIAYISETLDLREDSMNIGESRGVLVELTVRNK